MYSSYRLVIQIHRQNIPIHYRSLKLSHDMAPSRRDMNICCSIIYISILIEDNI